MCSVRLDVECGIEYNIPNHFDKGSLMDGLSDSSILKYFYHKHKDRSQEHVVLFKTLATNN